MLIVIFGMAAFVIDVGALYQERRELQNGADAGALAVAQDCAAGDCLDEYATAGNFADQNAEDDVSALDEVCGDGPGLVACADPPDDIPAGATGWVSVSTSTEDVGGGTQISFVFAPILDAALDGKTVDARAIAAWGPPSSIETVPLTFSVCEYEEYGGSIDPTVIPEGEHYIYFHGSDEAEEVAEVCDIGPAGQDTPGGFGWLDSAGNCDAVVADGAVDGETGNSFNSECEQILRDAVDNETILVIPIFSEVNGNGSNAVYTIVGFAGFKITGYKLGGQGGGTGAVYPNGFGKCPEGNGASATCIRGEFAEAVVDGGGGFGGGDNFGVVVVRMIG